MTFRQEVLAKSKIALGLTHLRPKSSTMDYMVYFKVFLCTIESLMILIFQSNFVIPKLNNEK